MFALIEQRIGNRGARARGQFLQQRPFVVLEWTAAAQNHAAELGVAMNEHVAQRRRVGVELAAAIHDRAAAGQPDRRLVADLGDEQLRETLQQRIEIERAIQHVAGTRDDVAHPR